MKQPVELCEASDHFKAVVKGGCSFEYLDVAADWFPLKSASSNKQSFGDYPGKKILYLNSAFEECTKCFVLLLLPSRIFKCTQVVLDYSLRITKNSEISILFISTLNYYWKYL